MNLIHDCTFKESLYSTFPFHLLDKRSQLHLWWRSEACLDIARRSVDLEDSRTSVAKSRLSCNLAWLPCKHFEQVPPPQTPVPQPPKAKLQPHPLKIHHCHWNINSHHILSCKYFQIKIVIQGYFIVFLMGKHSFQLTSIQS